MLKILIIIFLLVLLKDEDDDEDDDDDELVGWSIILTANSVKCFVIHL